MRSRIGRSAFSVLFALLLWTGAAQPVAAQEGVPPASSVGAVLAQAVGDGRAVGVVVGLLDPDGSRRVFAHGSPGEGARPLDGESVFEIGSITKVFTGTLLADMVRRGEVRLSDPVAMHLPPGVRVPSRNGREITLLDLATHRSGLPGMPDNLPEGDPHDPYADYTEDLLYAFLAGYELPREPGESFEYSNLGMGLLGHALARRGGKSYAALLQERVLAPLGMVHTGVTCTPEMERRLVRGHDRGGFPQKGWTWSALHGAGALRSTIDDLLTFAQAAVSDDTLPVHAALREALRVHRPSDDGSGGIGLSWGIFRQGENVMARHDGRTYGYSSYLVLDLTTRRAVVVLTNSYSNALDGLDLHLLDPAVPLPRPSVWVAVAAAYRTGGVEAALSSYQRLLKTGRDRWHFDETALATVGEWLLWRGAVEDAIAVLRLNASVYPESPAPHLSLGDAYGAAERLREAVSSYRRAVALAEAVNHPELSVYRDRLQAALQRLDARGG